MWFAWLVLLMNLFYFFIWFFVGVVVVEGKQLNREIDSKREGNSKRFRFMGNLSEGRYFYHTCQSIHCLLFFVFGFFFSFFCFVPVVVVAAAVVVHFRYRCWCRNNSLIDKNHLHLFSFLWWRLINELLPLYCLSVVIVVVSVVYLHLYSDCCFAWKADCRLNPNKCHHPHATNLMVK